MNRKGNINRSKWYPIMAAVLLVGMGCSMLQTLFPDNPPGPNANPEFVDPGAEGGTMPISMENGATDGEEPGFNIILSDGSAQPQVFEPIEPIEGEPLTEEEVAAILARLPEMQVEEGDVVEFKIPPDVLPPPRPGETIDLQFPPPPETLEIEIESGPLEVLRYSPEGEIPMAPFLSATFNQPMVPLGTLAQLAEEDVPVVIEPALEGTWRWIGTKTLTFQYDSDLIDRLPMATEFTATIAAGTESATGGVLAQDVTWKFSTPPPFLTNYWPHEHDPQPLDPLFFIAFDQRIDPDAVLATIEVTADGKTTSIRLATEKEIKDDEVVSRLIDNTPDSRWLAFKATSELPADSSIQVVIGPGTPSAEGPLVTKSSQSYGFNTYAPLRIDDYGCSWYGDECYPLSPFYIRFNNPLDADLFKEDMLAIDPPLPGATVSIFGDTISIKGASEGSTTYRITIGAELTDGFGQQLGRDEKISIKVGKAEPVLIGPENLFVTLDPATSKPALSLYTINYNKLDVEIYAVQPSDWLAFKEFVQEYNRTDQPGDPPGRLVMDDTLRLEVPTDVLTEVSVELSDVMDGEFGHFIVIVKPPKGFFEENRYWEHVVVWVQITQIGLDAIADHSELIAWATDLQSGASLAGVTIGSDSNIINQTTKSDGLVRFDIPSSGINYLTAQKGDDIALLPRSIYMWSDDKWIQRTVHDTLHWYVFDDRAMYKPGEEVHVKGWMRRVGGKQNGDVTLVGDAVSEVSYSVIDPQGNDLGGGKADLNAYGGFDFAFLIPENANLGYAQIYISARGSLSLVENTQYYHSFQIQEFRRPEFEVSARNETTGPYFVGDQAVVAVEAAYYAGGALPNAEVTWQVSSSETNYQPPNWPDFTFGSWTPWWWYGWDIEAFYFDEFGMGGQFQTFEGRTDATGNHYLAMDFEGDGTQRAQSVYAEAIVMDVNRQAWAGSTSLLVHPAELYVGMRTESYFVERGEPIEVDLIVVDLEGNPVVDRLIQVKADRMDWKYQNGRWQQLPVDTQECSLGSEEEPVTCTFETLVGGRYQITATVTDAKGRENESQLIRWVSGGQQPPSREVEQEVVTLIPDKETYQPGDTALILVQSPFSPAEGLLTVARSGILYTERFMIEDGTTTLEVKIEEAHIPNLNLQVDLVGSVQRTDDEGEVVEGVPARPAFASGQLNISIPPLGRTLALNVTPRDTILSPGGKTTIDVTLVDAEGKPVSDAELAVVVVDEAILALTNYQLSDPMMIFYTTRYADTSSNYARSSILLIDPQRLSDETREIAATQALAKDVVEESEMMMEAPAAEAAPMEAGIGGGEAQAPSIDIRTDFNPLALFAPSEVTDSLGKASIQVTLPDNLTRYRIMVVAVDETGKRFGTGESNLTARLPLMVRPSAPRFLNFGDRFELPVVLQNQTDEEMIVEVAVNKINIDLTEEQGLRVTVPPNDRVEVRFPATTVSAGNAHFQIAAVSDEATDASLVSLPVYTPATTEAFATYGVLDEGAIAQPVASPEDVFSQYGGLEITTSSTALQALTDAVLYLVSYPYDCSEQMASRILGVAALRDVLSAFEAEGLPSPVAMEASVNKDIADLSGLQNWDGGFPYWRRGMESIPYNSVHVAHALQRARQMGFEVPEDMWYGLLQYITYIEEYYPYWYSQQTRWTISAYALYVRNRMGDPDPEKAEALLEDAGLERLSLDAVAWIWQILVDKPGYDQELEDIRRHVNNKAVETANAANFTTSYADDDYVLLHSDRRTDALLLDAIIADNPESDLISKVVNGLLAHRKKGHWRNTQENVFVLLALDRYFNTYESVEPDFVARIWLGETYAGESEFVGYSTERHQIDIPMAYLVDALGENAAQDLIISKEGDGRLYYRLGMRYAPKDLQLPPVDMGFVVQRIYEGVDDKDDVRQDENGIWYIKAGARVRIRVTMVADNRRYHVALVDPLPAGLEIINPALAVAESVPQDPNSAEMSYWWWWRWYEHQNLRDERAEAFTSLLWDGVYEYTYVARATVPGRFIVPPAKAEEMYSPEVFGRSASDVVIVE